MQWNRTTYLDGEGNCDNITTYGYITDGNTGWDNSYGFVTTSDDTVSSTEFDNICSTNDRTVVRTAGTWQCFDYSVWDDYDSLSDLQTAVSNDFHNLGGTDDDDPESGDVSWSDLTDQGTHTDTKYCTYASGTGFISCNSDAGSNTDITNWTAHNSYPAACSAGSAVTAIGDTLTCADYYDATDDTVSDCTEADACTIDSNSMEGTDWGTLTNGYYCTYDSANTEIDCNSLPNGTGSPGTSIWTYNNDIAVLNTSYADNVQVNGWLNVTETKLLKLDYEQIHHDQAYNTHDSAFSDNDRWFEVYYESGAYTTDAEHMSVGHFAVISGNMSSYGIWPVNTSNLGTFPKTQIFLNLYTNGIATVWEHTYVPENLVLEVHHFPDVNYNSAYCRGNQSQRKDCYDIANNTNISTVIFSYNITRHYEESLEKGLLNYNFHIDVTDQLNADNHDNIAFFVIKTNYNGSPTNESVGFDFSVQYSYQSNQRPHFTWVDHGIWNITSNEISPNPYRFSTIYAQYGLRINETSCNKITTSANGTITCGTDDDDPESGDVSWSDLTDQGTHTDAKYCTYASGTGFISCNSDAGSNTDITNWTAHNSYPAACSAGSAVTAIGDTLTCADYYDATDDTVSDCTEADACTIDSNSMEGTDWGTLTNGYYCTYDSAGTEIDCNTQYTVATDTDCTSQQYLDGDGNCDTGYLDADGTDAYNSAFDTEDEIEAVIFDADNTANLGMGNYNITAIQCLTFQNGAKIGDCD